MTRGGSQDTHDTVEPQAVTCGAGGSGHGSAGSPNRPQFVIRWAVLWRSYNFLDGQRRYFFWCDGVPLLFSTRREARAWIEIHYGYIRHRPDLRREPHGWQMPLAVRAAVSMSVCDPQHAAVSLKRTTAQREAW